MITKHGIVTAAKMTRTVTVTVHRSVVHPLYQKRYRVSTKFLADTGDMTVHVGDEVTITECRPMSKRKYFKITEITKKAPQVSEMAEEKGLAEAIGQATKGTDPTSLDRELRGAGGTKVHNSPSQS